MLRRSVLNKLDKWKNTPNKMALVVNGARQIGKTFAIREFGEQNYKNVIEINFEERPLLKEIFAGDLDVDSIIEQITLRFRGENITPKETLLFFDEVQSCPNARTALKFFTQDGRFDVIASGSLLGLQYKEVGSYPVGYVEFLDMYSLSFEEYLWANGVTDKFIAKLKDNFDNLEPIASNTHIQMLKFFREYIVVGGMPKVVQNFMDNRNYQEVQKLQEDIIRGYTDDIMKYAPAVEKTRAKECLISIPRQLAKEYKKFQYSVVEKGATKRKYGNALLWLLDANIVNFCNSISLPELPFEGYVKMDIFKVYMQDTGLLVSMLGEDAAKDIIDNNLGIYKGAIYENIIADILHKNKHKLYFFEKNSKIEMDFFIRYRDKATALEVKSSENTKSKSLDSLFQNYGVKSGIKLSTKNIGTVKTGVISLPLYMAMFL
ncbi:MAG: ATP-binding protein [Candidatus Ancillula sp.]|jgi:predicted AAA+ superfamily ATPase|nr:ATP-binding protein [Candidatus Ancillula sp.]